MSTRDDARCAVADRHGFAKLVVASTVSNVGDGVFLVALPLLATDLTRDPTAIAAVVLAMRLPWLVSSLLAGEVTDRVDRRRLIWRTDVLRTVAVVALAALVATDRASMASLYAIGVLLGIGETFRDNAAQVIVPSLVAGDRLEWANGRLASLETVTNRFIGPPLGGLLAAIGLTLPFVFDALTFAAAAVCVALIGGRYRAAGARPSRRILPGIKTGLDWLWQHTQLRTLALLLGVLTCLATAGEAILVLYAQDILGVGDVGYGLLISAGAVGAVVSGLVTAWRRRALRSAPSPRQRCPHLRRSTNRARPRHQHLVVRHRDGRWGVQRRCMERGDGVAQTSARPRRTPRTRQQRLPILRLGCHAPRRTPRRPRRRPNQPPRPIPRRRNPHDRRHPRRRTNPPNDPHLPPQIHVTSPFGPARCERRTGFRRIVDKWVGCPPNVISRRRSMCSCS